MSEIIKDNLKYVEGVSIVQIDNASSKRKSTEVLVAQARRAFQTEKTKSLAFRKKQLKNLIRFLQEEEDALCNALYKDLRKSTFEAITNEIVLVIKDAQEAINNLEGWCKPESVNKTVVNFFDKLMIYKDPYGVVLVIGAWNYPINILLLPVVGAIAAGNCVVIKPSDCAPATAEILATVLPKYLDSECYPVFVGGVPETTELLKQKFDYIFFTGSTYVGKIVYQAATEYLTPTTLELGGKSPVYIDKSADLKLATKRIMWGKLLNAGQTCVAPDYVLCSKDVQQKFIEYAEETLAEFYAANIKNSKDFGRIVNRRQFDRLFNLIKNQKIAVGGQPDPEDLFIPPTILVDVDSNDSLMQEEIFGPVLPILNVESAEEAIDFINQREKPLVIYVFSKKAEVQNAFLERTSSGGVSINETIMHVAAVGLPFGGVGNSGMGSYKGKTSFDTFTHKKSVLKKNYCILAEKITSIRYPPYTKFHSKLLKNVLRYNTAIPTKCISYLFVFGLGVAATIGGYYLKNYLDEE